MEAVHEVTVPPVIYLLNQLGYIPYVYFNKRALDTRGDIFKYCRDLKFKLFYVEINKAKDWHSLQTKINALISNFDFIIANTFQNPGPLKFISDFNKPIIGLVHNVDLFIKNELSLEIAERTNVFLLSIAYHVALSLRYNIGINSRNINFFTPAFLTDHKHYIKKKDIKSKIKISVIGGVNLQTRAFDELIESVEKIDYPLIEIMICGGGSHREKLETIVKEKKLENQILFAELDKNTSFVMYDEYFSHIADSHFILSLLPQDGFLDYIRNKATSIFMTAISLEIPIITDSISKHVYRLPCVSYENGNLHQILKLLPDMDINAYQHMVDEIKVYKQQCLKEGQENLNDAINYIKK